MGKIENRKKFNGIEHTTDLDLNQYDAFYRNFDPQIGRFLQIDPKIESAEGWSPYSAMLDNPILNIDPLGDSSVPWPARVGQASITAAPIYMGFASIKAANVRVQYNKATATLHPEDSKGRARMKEVYRNPTPEPFRATIEKGRPMNAEREKANDPNYKGDATKTNVEVNETMRATGVIGKGLVVVAATQSAIQIAKSDNPVKETVTEAGGWVGAEIGGCQGALLGSEAGPWGALAGAIIGGSVGFFMGKEYMEQTLNGRTGDLIKKNREIVPDWNPRPQGGLGN